MIDAFIYDLEIVKAIPNKNEERMQNIQYCDGWHDHAGMGMSCLCGYDTLSQRTRVLLNDNVKDFQEYTEGDTLIVTFNGINFDDKVLRACFPDLNYPLTTPHYDILAEVRGKTGQFVKLDQLCRDNGLTVKSGSGAFAPVLWQQKKFGEVIDYCCNDVQMTWELYELIVKNEGKINMRGHEITLRTPAEYLEQFCEEHEADNKPFTLGDVGLGPSSE